MLGVLLAALLASSSFVQAAQPSSFKIKQVAAPRRRTTSSKIEASFQPWAKYRKPLNDVQKQAKAHAAGSAVAYSEPDEGWYLLPVQIGSPPQTFLLDLDTGSSDLWVLSNYTTTSLTYSHTLYKPGPSATLLQNYTWSIEYGDGSTANGIVFRDTVSIGGVTAQHQAVEAAYTVASDFATAPLFDGLLGLAGKLYNAVRPVKQLTWFDSVLPILNETLFAANLHPTAPGEYDFGFIDTSSYTGDITWTDVLYANETGYWLIDVGGYSIDGAAGADGDIGLAIVDTGTTLFYIPKNQTYEYYQNVRGIYWYQDYTALFPCNETLPDFTVQIQGVPFTVPGNQLNYGSVGFNNLCLGGIQQSTGLGINILGDAFIQNFYVIFKYIEEYKKQVGFANKPVSA